MLKLLKTPGRAALALFTAGIFAAAYGAVARPGTVNYAEGQVAVNGNNVTAKSLGSTEVAAGQIIETRDGKAEMLLFPGAYLRLGENSSARMVSPSITDTRVELLRGRGMVEVDQIRDENHLRIIDQGTGVRLTKKGVYSFDADRPLLAVYDGKALVQKDDREVEVGKGKLLPLEPQADLKPQKFDRKQTDSLYEWSRARSEILAEANMASARMIVVDNYRGGFSSGWHWNPWYSTWSFIPGDGYLYSPFGYGFYSPTYYFYNPPVYYYRPGRVYARPGGSAVQLSRPAPATQSAPAMGNSGTRFGGRRR